MQVQMGIFFVLAGLMHNDMFSVALPHFRVQASILRGTVQRMNSLS